MLLAGLGLSAMPLVLTTSPEAHADALASTYLSTPDRASSPAWGAAPAADAHRRRAERGGRLLFDRLLSEAGVDGASSARRTQLTAQRRSSPPATLLRCACFWSRS